MVKEFSTALAASASATGYQCLWILALMDNETTNLFQENWGKFTKVQRVDIFTFVSWKFLVDRQYTRHFFSCPKHGDSGNSGKSDKSGDSGKSEDFGDFHIFG